MSYTLSINPVVSLDALGDVSEFDALARTGSGQSVRASIKR